MSIGDVKISEGKKYSTNEVASNGVTKKDVLTKNPKMAAIFEKFDLDKNGTLDKNELAQAMDFFQQTDTNNNQKISKKEFNAAAKAIGEDLNGKDLKSFFKNLVQSMSGEKINTNQVIADAKKQAVENAAPLNTPAGITPKESAPPTKLDPVKLPPKTFDYTVQKDEKYIDILKNSLKAKGVENPTPEELKAEDQEFKQNNPDAVKSKKGIEYLNVGAKVKTTGKLQDKNNAAQQQQDWATEHIGTDATKAAADKAKADAAQAAADKAAADKAKAAADKAAADAAKAGVTPAPTAPTAPTKKSALRKTDCPTIYYNEKTKTHMKWNNDTKTFEKLDATRVFKDGSYVKKFGTDADGDTYSERYNAKGQKTHSMWKWSDGSSSLYTFDAKGNETKSVDKDAKGNVTCSAESTYDAKGNKTCSRESTYDANGNLTKRVDKFANKNSVESTYDANGNKTKSVNKYASGSSQESTYNAKGNVTKCVYKDADENETSSAEATYDANGNQTKVVYKDAKGKEISLEEWQKI